ncbi:UNVERIFIED_CONTAM: ornithine cyclodeaminase [Bacillus mycoides]|nr:ornithine cyclodeaminase [Bacillus mycoides]TXR89823.1 ornithine cyclodeaminase [Bacillus sp. AR13-1]QWG81254.1 ornithine cyclodeaminase [Bacillus mycoides]QWI40841.1 ornithine cyclodeaminase [Bacillus mycoides]QWI72732.1 ornithine cyclodeaminase [Bacillus mycoides]
MFKSVGLAVVDIIVANYLYEKAVECGIGLSFEGLPFGVLFCIKSCKARKSRIFND